MKLKQKALVAATLSTTLGMTMFTGCGVKNTAQKATKGTKNVAQKTAKGAKNTANATKNKIGASVNNATNKAKLLTKTTIPTKQTIVFWHGWTGAEQDALNKAIADFKKKEPNIIVKQTPIPFDKLNDKLKVTLQGKSNVDVFIGPSDWAGTFSTMKRLENIDSISILKKHKKDMLPSALKGGMFKGKLMAFPESIETSLLVYNKTLVKTAPKTVDQLITMAKKATKGGTYGLVMDKTNYYFQRAWYAGYGGKEFKSIEKATPDFNNKKYISFLKLMKKFEDAKIMPKSVDYNTMMSLFTSGKAAFMINGPWSFGDIDKSAMKGKYALANYPKIGGKDSKPFLGVKEFYIPKASTHKVAAAKFIEYMTSEKVQKMFLDKAGHIPANIKVKLSANKNALAVQNQAKIAEPTPNIPETATIWDPLKDSIFKVQGGVSTPEKAAKEAQDKIVAAISKMK